MHRSLRWLLLSSVLVFSLSLFGCGGGSNESQTDATSNEAAEAPESDLKSEEFKDVVLVDNDTVTITLEKLYQTKTNMLQSDGSTKEIVENCMVMKYKDKTEFGSLINMTAYLNDEKLWTAITGGGNGTEAGKASTTSYALAKDSQPDPEELDSFDDMYNTTLAFEIMPKDENGYLGETTNVEVALNDAIKGNATSDAKDDSAEKEESSKSTDNKKASTKPISVGDTITNDNWEITLVRAELTEEALPNDTSSYYFSYEANDGTVFLDLVYDIKCIASKGKTINDIFGGARVTYAGKYEYEGIEVYYDDDDGHLRNASRVAFDPLQTWQLHYMVYGIPEEAVSSDESLKALLLIDDQLWELNYR